MNPDHPRIDRLELGVIALGGAVGALSRVGLSQAFPPNPGSWPWVTFAINLLGTFALGFFVTYLQRHRPLSTLHHPLLATGLCGTFTTFSTMQLEVLRMIDRHHDGLALAYLASSVAGGYLLVSLATAMVRRAEVPAEVPGVRSLPSATQNLP
jgi:fluoride exporter